MTKLRADVALSVILFAGTCTYLGVFWPHALYGLDEGMFLYESKRIVDGQVMYRDFFELWGPMGNYALALMYALFGVSMETARGSMAVVHAVIVVLVYAIMRRLGVRPMLAAVLSLTHIALFFPALAFASPHWLSTALTLMEQWALKGALHKFRNAINNQEREAARKEVMEALAALERARAAAGLPPK